MLENLRKFPFFLEERIKNGFSLPSRYKKVHNIVIAGMGGSAIAGIVAKDAFFLKTPLETSKGYSLPSWVNQNTLLICISYSGNTKETLSQFYQGLKKKAKIIVITSGGKLRKEAKKAKVVAIEIPKNFLPRESLPFLLGTLIQVLKTLNLLQKNNLSFRFLKKEVPKIEKKAMTIAKKIKKTFPIICSQYFSVSFRWESQLSENSKHLSESKTLPELAHNEIESWRQLNKKFTLIFLRDQKEKKEIKNLIEGIKKIINQKTYTLEIKAKGETRIERILYLILFGDFVSYFLAKEKKINPKTTDYIKKLKKVISK